MKSATKFSQTFVGLMFFLNLLKINFFTGVIIQETELNEECDESMKF
jgi:hypothetical protein